MYLGGSDISLTTPVPASHGSRPVPHAEPAFRRVTCVRTVETFFSPTHIWAGVSRVVCAGHVNWDVTLCVDSLPAPDCEATITEQTRAGGGSASNAAAALAALGVDVALLGSVGTDESGRFVRQELTAAGVDCTHLRAVAGAETTVKYILVDGVGQVTVLANDGANEAFAAGDIDDPTLAGADLLHLTGQPPDTAAALAERAASAGVTVSVDPGRRLADRDLSGTVSLASYLFLNECEADVARRRGLVDAVDGMTIVTRGEGGGRVVGDDRTVDHPGFDVDAVDTAGAGDAFAAGFLAARLDGAGARDALSAANACGALASLSLGARSTPAWDAVDELRTGSG
jgi:ribokinase